MRAVSNVPQLVGIQINQGLRLGQTSTVTATAGSNSLLGILAGLDGTTTTTHPAVVEPIIGSSQLVTLIVATPAAGATVPCPIAVPNLAALVGLGVYVQAFQLDSLGVRASAAIGSAVH